jgi:acyl carrier protein
MTNKQKYAKIFTEVLGIKEEQAKGLEFQAIPSWDSIGHMSLITSLEDEFDIMMDTEDVIDFSSFEKGIEIMGKYGVEF